MTDDPRAALLAAASDGAGAHSALRALRHALQWSAQAIGDVAPADSGDPTAIELVMALDDALSEVAGLVARAPALTEAAMAGPSVREYLDQRGDALTELARRIAVARQEHDELAAIEAQLRDGAEEHQRLVERIDELRRLRRLHDELPALREQQAALATAAEAMTGPVGETMQALRDTSEHLVTLDAERQADLDARTRELLATLARAQQQFAELTRQHTATEAQLHDKHDEYEKLRDEHANWLPALNQLVEIDADLRDRLAAARDETTLDRVHGMLTRAQTVLDDVDAALGVALRRYDEVLDKSREVLPWRG